MKKTFAVILLIALVLLAAAFGLQKVTLANMQKEHIWLMQTLLPGSTDFERITYTGEDPTIRSVHQASEGYIIETATQGYADEIVMLVGVNNSGKVTGLVTLEAHETPGLGSKILTDYEFLSHFLNRTGSFSIAVSGADAFSGATAQADTSGEEIAIDGISGATVSSKAVTRCVNAAIAYVTGVDAVSSATTWGG